MLDHAEVSVQVVVFDWAGGGYWDSVRGRGISMCIEGRGWCEPEIINIPPVLLHGLPELTGGLHIR